MARRKRVPNKKEQVSKEGSNVSDTSTKATVSTEAKTKEDLSSDKIPTGSNDPEWYSRDPRLTLDSASIPFSQPFGSKLELLRSGGMAFPGAQWSVDEDASDNNGTIPGICSLKLKTSVGSNLSISSPLNIAANALYSHVRYVNNGRKNYDPADLMLYVMFFGDLYSYLIWCMRLYNLAFMYSQRNWYIGKSLIEANGVDAEDLKLNLANFRYMINLMIRKVASYAVPADIYYFRRRAFLFANYYVENPYGNIKDQLYQFVPDGFYAFTLDDDGAGKLAYTQMDFSHKWKLQDFDIYFQMLMLNVTGDEDFGLMSGDILRAYGDNILKLGDLGEEGGLLPVFDPYVLSQFKNAIVCDGLYRGDATQTYTFNDKVCVFGDVCQGGDGVLYSLEKVDWNNSKGLSAVVACEQLINVENPEPNVGDVLEATRLHTHYYVATPNIGYVIGGGTEIVVDVIISLNPNSTRRFGAAYYNGHRNIDTEWCVTDATITTAAVFKYAPINYIIAHADGSNVIRDMEPVSNLENVAIISAQQLARINEAAMLSLFYVPGVAKLI